MIDVKIIDGFIVNGLAQIADLAGRAFGLLQSGVLGHYLLYLLIALILLLQFLVL